MDETAALLVKVPIIESKGVVINFLAHPAARRQAHSLTSPWFWSHVGRSPKCTSPISIFSFWKPGFEQCALHGINHDLQAAMLSAAGDLFLRAVAGTYGHGHKLTNLSLGHAVPIQPRLPGRDHVVLGTPVQAVRPGLAGDGVDLSSGHLDGEWIMFVVVRKISRTESEPQRLG